MQVVPYGVGDQSFQTAGGEPGIRRLVTRFYELMDSLPQAAGIRAMHPGKLTGAVDRLTRFLCGWMGGPLFIRRSTAVSPSPAPIDIFPSERKKGTPGYCACCV